MKIKLSWKNTLNLEIQPNLFDFQLSFGQIWSFGYVEILVIWSTPNIQHHPYSSNFGPALKFERVGHLGLYQSLRDSVT